MNMDTIWNFYTAMCAFVCYEYYIYIVIIIYVKGVSKRLI